MCVYVCYICEGAHAGQNKTSLGAGIIGDYKSLDVGLKLELGLSGRIVNSSKL